MSQEQAKSYEYSAKTVDAAIEEGLHQLGLTADRVTVDVLNKGSRGILGLGSEAARVRLTPIVKAPTPVTPIPAPAPAPVVEAAPPAPVEPSPAASTPQAPKAPVAVDEPSVSIPVPTPAPAQASRNHNFDNEDDSGEVAEDPAALESLSVNLLSQMLTLMSLDAHVVPTWENGSDGRATLILDIQGRDLGVLIGRYGKTLASMQYLLRLMINQQLRQWPSVVVDVEQYKAKRKTRLTAMAHRIADQVVESGQSVAMEPMPAADRRLIHLALRDHPGVFTQSVGEDERRKVQILIKK
ncbi:MAG: Jag N-terminal domain-containing protein [Caldilineaceae bacterium]|nr:Jag N-terminal domain-containing protein [Caldilineaceae bacterium]MBP8107533.1 Jag N-terminal domain-containing protein [Caldilineaceae bacterium]MBP8122489.1 Jag N-terminal domain-containing protein [Caldilineaceae bacterium]